MKLYIDPGYSNVGWAADTGASGYLVLTGSTRDRVEKLRRELPVADELIVEAYNSRSATLSGSTTLLIIGALYGMHLDVTEIGNATWRAAFSKRIEGSIVDITERLQFVDTFENILNEHERDACKMRYALGGIKR